MGQKLSISTEFTYRSAAVAAASRRVPAGAAAESGVISCHIHRVRDGVKRYLLHHTDVPAPIIDIINGYLAKQRYYITAHEESKQLHVYSYTPGPFAPWDYAAPATRLSHASYQCSSLTLVQRSPSLPSSASPSSFMHGNHHLVAVTPSPHDTDDHYGEDDLIGVHVLDTNRGWMEYRYSVAHNQWLSPINGTRMVAVTSATNHTKTLSSTRLASLTYASFLATDDIYWVAAPPPPPPPPPPSSSPPLSSSSWPYGSWLCVTYDGDADTSAGVLKDREWFMSLSTPPPPSSSSSSNRSTITAATDDNNRLCYPIGRGAMHHHLHQHSPGHYCVHYPRRVTTTGTTSSSTATTATATVVLGDPYLYHYRALEAYTVVGGRLNLTTGVWSSCDALPSSVTMTAAHRPICYVSLDGFGILCVGTTIAWYDSATDVWFTVNHWSATEPLSHQRYRPQVKLIWDTDNDTPHSIVGDSTKSSDKKEERAVHHHRDSNGLTLIIIEVQQHSEHCYQWQIHFDSIATMIDATRARTASPSNGVWYRSLLPFTDVDRLLIT